MNIERLQHLIVILNKINTANFNLEGWGKINTDANISIKAQQECGSVCCAIGWSLLSPKFRKEGLRYSKFHSYFVGKNAISPVYGKDEYGHDIEGWEAVSKFFGIKCKTATHLFNASSYSTGDSTTPQQVIERIKAIIEHGENF